MLGKDLATDIPTYASAYFAGDETEHEGGVPSAYIHGGAADERELLDV